jgi:hypothetical protein
MKSRRIGWTLGVAGMLAVGWLTAPTGATAQSKFGAGLHTAKHAATPAATSTTATSTTATSTTATSTSQTSTSGNSNKNGSGKQHQEIQQIEQLLQELLSLLEQLTSANPQSSHAAHSPAHHAQPTGQHVEHASAFARGLHPHTGTSTSHSSLTVNVAVAAGHTPAQSSHFGTGLSHLGQKPASTHTTTNSENSATKLTSTTSGTTTVASTDSTTNVAHHAASVHSTATQPSHKSAILAHAPQPGASTTAAVSQTKSSSQPAKESSGVASIHYGSGTLVHHQSAQHQVLNPIAAMHAAHAYLQPVFGTSLGHGGALMHSMAHIGVSHHMLASHGTNHASVAGHAGTAHKNHR